MTDISVAFWNLQNLFDITASEIAADFEFTPSEGWDQATLDKKIENLAEVLALMHGGAGADLLGICEVENKKIATTLMNALGRPDYRQGRALDFSMHRRRNGRTGLLVSERWRLWHEPAHLQPGYRELGNRLVGTKAEWADAHQCEAGR